MYPTSRSRLLSLALAAVLGVQIWTSVVVFRKWDDALLGSDKLVGAVRSDYQDEDGHWRGMWEMSGLLSDLGKGSQFPGFRAKIETKPVTSDTDTFAFQMPITDRALGVEEPLEVTVAYGGGTCTDDSDCDAGVCTTDGGTPAKLYCICDPLSFGSHCESSLSDLGVPTVVCTGDTPVKVVTNPPLTWTALLNVAYCADITADGDGILPVKIFIDEYDRTKGGFSRLSKLNIAVLSGVYLILSMIVVAYTLLANVFGSVFGLDAILQLVRLDPQTQKTGFMRDIAVAVTSSLMDVLAILALVGGIWMLAGATPSGHVYASEAYAGVGVTNNLKYDPTLAGSTAAVAYMIPLGLMAAVCALTVVSRTTRALGGRGAAFASLICSTMIIVIVCDAYFMRARLAQQLNSIMFATIVSFEIMYAVSRLLHLRGSAVFIGLKAAIVVSVLYVSARRAANFNPDHVLHSAAESAIRIKETGSPFYQLGPKRGLCHFLYDDMLRGETPSSWMSDQWLPYRPTDNGDFTADEQWWCIGDRGTVGYMSRVLVLVPIVVYVVTFYVLHTRAIGAMHETVAAFIGDVSLRFRRKSYARVLP